MPDTDSPSGEPRTPASTRAELERQRNVNNENTPQHAVPLATEHPTPTAVALPRIEWDMLAHELDGVLDNSTASGLGQYQAAQQNISGIDSTNSFQNLFFYSTSDEHVWTATQYAEGTGAAGSFDWGFTDVPDNDIFEAIGALPQPPPPPPSDPQVVIVASPISSGTGSVAGRSPPDRDSEIVRALKAEEVDGQPNTGDLPNGSPEESAWPTVYYQPNTPVDPVNLPTVTRPSTPTPRATTLLSTFAPDGAASGTGDLLRTISACVNAQARMSMQILATYAHRPVWPLPDLANFPSIPSLTACVNCYLAHFSAWLPIVDSPRGSFRVDKAAPILLMAMASVGAVYASGGLEKLAFPLDELVRRQIVYICEHDHRFVLEPCVMQASLLQSYFGLYNYSAARELQRRDPTASSEAVQKAMRQDHRYSRLGWSIFLFDAQMLCFFGTPCHYALSDIQVSLPVDAITTAAVPGTEAAASHPRAIFGQILASLLDHGQLLEEPSDMGLSCLAYALYRICLESASSRALFQQSRQAPHVAQKRLDQLARHVTDTPASLTALRLSCVAVSRHAYLELTDPGLLGAIKVAAGRLGEQEQQAAQVDVARRLKSDPAGARCLFAHAAMLRCLLNRFTFDTPTEVIWTFDAALAMWAFLRFSGQSLNGQKSNNATSILLTWKPSPSINEWVKTGRGGVSVQGIGNGSSSDDNGTITAAAVLRGASERLEVMSWGLAAKYRVVLKGMLAQANA
ncbi:hypothetical protein Sste5346_006963 [Sporothrix stenoceras]|uniref:Xylanolytic transcriptional activator regulatory domain-containing protein n=1 Tax=Sporothrix stenoceras TaxID=5173 RepID=A0ABR3YXH1_9PEZI